MLRHQPTGAVSVVRDGEFATTHWTDIYLARQQSPEADAALSELCRIYWYPLYVFVRRQGHSHEDAQDLVQGFFAQLLEKDWLKSADRQKGKLRSFLLLALKRYMANQWDQAHRLKRGGNLEIISLDARDTEGAYRLDIADDQSPEKAFERQWVATLLERVLANLEVEYTREGKRELFNELRCFLSGDGEAGSRAEVGERLAMSEGNVRVALHRLRQRYRDHLRAEVGRTVDRPDAVNEEICRLFSAVM